mmetsp:Transcript_19629/g.42041  ORF Transcript_19629/g.42041 Transcript_19629/m.42041 type:complete len:392 (+) Transcript_19629:94-1269(+)|eukprot:CAMPEP_0172546094 /NCGR_PEP_ID=MMETSP1067-20121228/15902_1 /TAXON_ID=265564 ORGANISM="Thalassiosira punctigera, Strain Tpunct2005C2" /NCGR_SAMPLE_ID=MMETSP1067 /ASSEMBLY_ACC=CAM_ASM_000444 /LENGTH=391 /DNA_ID=CAMNT_0013332965 /DNA_START=72 /DNA_END=1247 /DNA_ORIENTATION=+
METFSIGVLGCANIAKKNCRAAKSAACRIAAVASRSDEKARDFVNEVLGEQKSLPTIFAGGNDAYDRLLNSDELDSVYVPLPTMLHERYVTRALSCGKHVLLEKPVATSSTSYRDMLDAASRNGKFLMDGTMFVHHPRTKQFVDSIPNPNRVTFNFTFDGCENFFKKNIRMKKGGDFMGCVGDLGWYCVRMGLLVFSSLDAGQLRGMVTAAQVVRYQLNEEGVPFEADCLVYFSGNRVLSFHCSFIHPLNQTVQISGTGSEYTATMTDAILPRPGDTLSYSLVKQNMIQYDEINVEERKEMQVDNSHVQEVCMWRNFAKWARKVEKESASASADTKDEKWWGGDSAEMKGANDIASYSLHTTVVLDALMQSIKLGGGKVRVKGFEVEPLPN